ncbi:MAG: DNA alkylation repair protein [Verrucomicrobia bacterium]|nr:DNA alkylation repair protein [Verrucomicrobiota bacterium]
MKKKPEPFKNWFNEALYRQIAQELAAIEPKLDKKKFLAITLDGLDQRELMDRVRQIAVAVEASLPGTYREKLAVLCQAAPRLKHAFVSVSFCNFVSRHGLEDFDHSMDALRFLTPFGSAEFAVRPFIERDPARALALMQKWANDKNEHVRRLASEGSRPRLPWGARLSAIVAKPDLTAPILETLMADPALYVRKSVANHLNDIAKDHPDWVLNRVEEWDRAHAGTAWIIRHALRTLIKKGHPRALALLGVNATAAAHVLVRKFTLSPTKLVLGDKFELTAELTSKHKKPLPLVIDYVIHYARATGKTSAKVFKWSEATLQPGEPLVLTKRQTIRDFTTRKHHTGRHRVELQVNGQRLAETSFQLKT